MVKRVHNQLQLGEKLFARSISSQKNNRLKLLTVSLIGTLLAGYFVYREIQLYQHKQLIQDCAEKKDCSGRTSALEKLVKAGKSLKSYNLISADLASANLKGANLARANFERANLESSNLSNTNLSHTNFINANLKFAHLSTAKLTSTNLSSSNLSSAYLSSADLYRADFHRANLHRAHLYNADFSSTYLYHANLSRAYLYRANLSNAYLSGANLHRAYLIEAQNLTPAQIKSACYWENGIYQGVWDINHFRWVVDEAANQQYIKQLKQDHASDPKEAVDCSIWKQK